MILSTGDALERRIYRQTGDYRIVLDVANMPSYLNFVMSSGSGTNEMVWKFDNKKYLNYNNRYSHIYETGGAFKFEFVKSGTQINTWINDILAESYATGSGFINSVSYLKLVSGSTETNFNLSFYGAKPNLTYGAISTADSSVYSGHIINNSIYETALFNITGLGINASYPSVISGGRTGTYLFSGEYLNSYSNVDLTFDFDFGGVSQNLSIADSTYYPETGSGFFNFSIESNNLKDEDTTSFNASYYAVRTGIINTKFEHVARIGSAYYTGSASGTGYYSGYLDGEGYLKSYTLSGYLSGYMGTGYGQIFSYATGTVIADYTIEVSGYESGTMATGFLQGFLTGVVGPGSGRYHFLGSLSGIPTVSVWHGGIFIAPTGIYTGQYNFYQNAVGVFTGYSSGLMTKAVSAAPAIMYGVQNHWTFKTGEPGGTLLDYAPRGWYSGNIFNNTGTLYASGELTDIEGEIGYISGSYGILDIGRLTMTSYLEEYVVDVYGTLISYNENDRIFRGYVVRDVAGTPTYKSIYHYPLSNTTVEE